MNAKDLYYSIAGLTLRIRIPAAMTEHLPASFAPFRSDGSESHPALTAAVGTAPIALPAGSRLLDDTVSDMGRVTLHSLPDGSYLIRLRDCYGSVHSLVADPGFSSAEISLSQSSAATTPALGSLLRIAFSQTVLLHSGISLHASCVVNQGNALLFLGKSGTGKSTHARLWVENIPDTSLLNDDNPFVRILDDGSIRAFGSPWSGKTPCYKACSASLQAVTRLCQANENRYIPMADIEAFSTLLPSCSVIKSSPLLHGALCDTLARISTTVPVGILHCLPDPSAPRLLQQKLTYFIAHHKP